MDALRLEERISHIPKLDSRHTIIWEMALSARVRRRRHCHFEERHHKHDKISTSINPPLGGRSSAQAEEVRQFCGEDQLPPPHHKAGKNETLGSGNPRCRQAQGPREANRGNVLLGPLKRVRPILPRLFKSGSAFEH